MSVRQHSVVALLLILLGVVRTGAEPITTEGTDTSDRIRILQKSLDDEFSHARYWYYGFSGFYVTATVASFGVAATTKDPVLHITQGVSGWQSLLATAGMLLSPMPSTSAGPEIRSMSGSTDSDQKARLGTAEEAVRTSAETQEFTRSWLNHAISIGVAGIGAAVIRYSYGKRIDRAGGGGRSVREAAVSFWGSVLVSEIQIWSMPTISLRTWSDYDQKYHPSAAGTVHLQFFFLPTGDQVMAGVFVTF